MTLERKLEGKRAGNGNEDWGRDSKGKWSRRMMATATFEKLKHTREGRRRTDEG